MRFGLKCQIGISKLEFVEAALLVQQVRNNCAQSEPNAFADMQSIRFRTNAAAGLASTRQCCSFEL